MKCIHNYDVNKEYEKYIYIYAKYLVVLCDLI